MRSRLWAVYVNALAPSRRLSPGKRRALYRLAGLPIGTSEVGAGCYFDSARITIGEGVTFADNVFVANTVHVTIGAHARLEPGVWIITANREIGPSGARAGAVD